MSLIPDFATLLSDAVGLSSPGSHAYGTGIRSAWVFTSSLRQRMFFQPSTNVRIGTAPSGRPIVQPQPPQTIVDDFYKGAKRSVMPFIEMAINPKSVRFNQPKRFTEKKTREGSVFFHFTNNQGQNNDILTLEFAGNTGNIDRRGSIDKREFSDRINDDPSKGSGSSDTGAIFKIMIWHQLYLLTREPMLLPDGSENVFTISYISPLFPQAIDFNGFFNEVLSFEENAEKPNSRDYDFSFTVQSTDPSLDEVMDAILTVLEDATLGPDATGQILGPNAGVVSP
jgi:hypothetical protein